MSAPHGVDESSETLDFGNNSVLDQSMGSSMLDSSMATVVRSSRRRMKGSAVVLNTDRLQKYIRKDEKNNQNEAAPKPEILGFKEQYQQKMGKRDLSVEEQQRLSAQRIVRWWHQYYCSRRDRVSQGGRWSTRQLDCVFAMLLGRRMRRLLRTVTIAQVIAAQRDIQKMLVEMYASFDHARLLDLGSYMPSWERLLRAVLTKGVDNLLLEHPGVSHSDLSLAASMCKQLLSERQKLCELVFGGAVIRRFPPPGYWDLSQAVKRAAAAQHEKNKRASILGASPARQLTAQKSNAETPPNVRRAMKTRAAPAKRGDSADPRQTAERVTGVAGDSEEFFLKQLAQEGVQRLRHSGEQKPRAIEPRLLSTPDRAESASGGRPGRDTEMPPGASAGVSSGVKATATHVNVTSPSPAPLTSATNSSVGSPQQPVERQRASQRGHIQLHVLSAEKLMPARKGAPLRDASGNPIADRIPCIKVKLLLPSWTAGIGSRNSPAMDTAATALKKVFEQTRDFTAVTLSPQWNAAFTLNLPCPRSVVQSIVTRDAPEEYDPDQELSDRVYGLVVRSLLQWWSLGTINIEVFDGERFNQEIFMGFIDLLLSGFMVLIKKPEELEIKGSFALQKLKPTDRVSGTVKLHAFMHAPDKAYIAHLLDPTTGGTGRETPLDLPVPTKGTVPGRASPHHMHDHTPQPPRQQPLQEGRRLLGDSDIDDTDAHSSPSSQSSPPEPPRPDGSQVVYSSKFMQKLARQSLQALSPPTVDTRAPGGSETLGDPKLEESFNIRFVPQQTAVAGEVVDLQSISESARLLKEKVRKARTARRPGSRTSGPAAPSTSDDEQQAQQVHAAVPAPLSPVAEESASVRLGQESLKSPTGSKDEDSSKRLPSPAVASLQGSRIPIPSTVAALVTASREQKQRSIGGGNVRRRHMEDISERLAGLSAVQQSTSAVLDSLNDKLEAKLRTRPDRPAFADLTMPTDEELMAALESPAPVRVATKPGRSGVGKRAMDEVRRRMAEAQLQEPADNVEEDSYGEEEVPPPPPAPPALPYDAARQDYGGASPARIDSPGRDALNASYHSPEEHADAPEIGAISEGEEEEGSDASEQEMVGGERDDESFGPADDISEGFENVYEDDEAGSGGAEEEWGNEDDEDAPYNDQKEGGQGGEVYRSPRRAVDAIVARVSPVVDEAEFWEYQSDTDDGESSKASVGSPVVHNAKRSNVNLAAKTSDRHVGIGPEIGAQAGVRVREADSWDDGEDDEVGVIDLRQERTIYAHDSEDDERGEGADGGHRSLYAEPSDVSSSVYSTSIMEFLSPEAPRHGARRGVGRTHVGYDHDSDDGRGASGDSNDELIVIRTGSRDSASLNNTASPMRLGSAGSGRFEVQSAHLLTSPERHSEPWQRQSQQLHQHRFSPSRSLFDAGAEEPPVSARRSHKSSRRSTPDRGGAKANSSSNSPRPHHGEMQSPGSDDKPHRVVLELDDLEL